MLPTQQNALTQAYFLAVIYLSENQAKKNRALRPVCDAIED
jgi:hypothetical protein